MRIFATWTLRALPLIALTLASTGCTTSSATSDVATSPTKTQQLGLSDQTSDGGGVEPLPTKESATQFGFDVVGHLEQEAMYANDSTFLHDIVDPDRLDTIAADLDTRVEMVRWAIATMPGETERTWYITAPLTVSVERFDPEAGTATINVWLIGVFSRQGLGMSEARYGTEQVDLRWFNNNWLITALNHSDGPDIKLADERFPVTPDELDLVLNGHAPQSARKPTP